MPSNLTHRTRRRPIFVAIGQTIICWFFRILLTLMYRFRVYGLENYPIDEGLLICSNHQSYLDPLILGCACPRPLNYLGRKSLFRIRPVGWFLNFNDTIPIDREATGIGGLKETLRRLKRGESVVMFPEGTRTPDGEFHSLKMGFCAVAKRAKSTLMPIGFDGAFQSYPRNQKLPRPGRIHVVIGRPIPFEEYQSLSDVETTELLEIRIRECFREAQRHWRRSHNVR